MGDQRGEDLLRWEEENLGLASEGIVDSGDPREPEWFADLLDGRLDAEERRCREEALREDPALESRYRAYARVGQTLRALGREESQDRGSPFLKARILAAVQEERSRLPGAVETETVPGHRRGIIPAMLASTGVAAAALFGLIYLLQWGGDRQHGPDVTRGPSRSYEGLPQASQDAVARGEDTDRSKDGKVEHGLEVQTQDKLDAGKGGLWNDRKQSGDLGIQSPPSKSPQDEMKGGRFALGGGQKASGNVALPSSPGKASGTDGYRGRSGRAKGDDPEQDATQVAERSKSTDKSGRGHVARVQTHARPQTESKSKPQMDQDVPDFEEAEEEVADNTTQAKKAVRRKSMDKKASGEMLDDGARKPSGDVMTAYPGKAAKAAQRAARASELEELAMLLDDEGPRATGRSGLLRTTHGIPTYKVVDQSQRGSKKGEVLLFACELSPRAAPRVAPELVKLEQGRLFFSRAGVSMTPRVGDFSRGADADDPATPAKVSAAPDLPGAPAVDRRNNEAGSKNAGQTPAAGDEAKKTNDAKVPARGLTSGKGPEEQQRAESRSRRARKDRANTWSSPKKVALHDLYDADEFFSTSNVMNRQGDEVLVLKGPKTQVLATLGMLLELSDRHALAYVPASTMSPLGANTATTGTRNGLEPGLGFGMGGGESQGPAPGKRMGQVPKSARKGYRGPGDQVPNAESSPKGKESPEPVIQGPVSGGAPEKAQLPAPGARQQELERDADEGSEKLAKQVRETQKAKEPEEVIEIRVLIRWGRHPVPGRASRTSPTTPTPGTPSSPTPTNKK